MGLPVKRFIIATNENDEVPVYLRTGDYKAIVPSINCISSAMNVGHPSNLARIVALYGGIMNETGMILKVPDIERMRKDFFAVSISDKETRETITGCYDQYGLLLEPHGAVAWNGLQKFLSHYPGEKSICISLETAHPSKFRDEIMQILKVNPSPHYSLAEIESETEDFITIDNNYNELKNIYPEEL